MSNHLSGGKLNVALLQDYLKKELLRLIDKCNGQKAIIWDEALAGPVGLIAQYNVLKEHGVEKMYLLKPGLLTLKHNIQNIIFISRPQLDLVDMIADNIHGEERSGVRRDRFLFFVPRRSQLCEKRLKSRGVYGSFQSIDDLPCDIFPFDSDVMSMELDTAFKEYMVEKDPRSLHWVAEAIVRLEQVYGAAARVSAKGTGAARVLELLSRRDPPSTPSPVDHLVLIDRAVDLLSPLATQLTYEGLIDEIFEIRNTTVSLPAEKFSNFDEQPNDMITDKKQIILNSSDELFADIRDKNFNAAKAALSRKAKLISSQIEERHREQTVEQLKQFVSKLPHILAAKKSVAIHTAVADLLREVTDTSEFLDSIELEQELMLGVDTDRVQPHIEDCIAQQQPLIKVLRLICLQSATNSGLKPKVVEHYKREILQTYGFHHILTLTNLEAAGLLKPQQSNRSYAVLRKTLRLTVEEGAGEGGAPPNDLHFVHSVYAPLSVRVVQRLVPGWRHLSDVMALLPGPTLDQRRGCSTRQSDGPKLVLVFFIGGCTLAEISALRFLNQQPDASVEYVIATTKLISGNSFIRSLMEPLGPSEK